MKKKSVQTNRVSFNGLRFALIFGAILLTVGMFGTGSAYSQTDSIGINAPDSGSEAARPRIVTLSQSVSNTIASPNTVACGNSTTGFTRENTYWRAFNLATQGVTTSFSAQSVTIGIERAQATGGSQTITVKLYTNTGAAFPGGTRTEIASNNFTIQDVAAPVLRTFNLPTAVNVPAGTNELVLSVTSMDFTTAGNTFYLGSNSLGETGPSYISAPACNINTPTTLSSINFPNVNVVIAVNGTTTAPSTAFFDFDGDGRDDISVFRPSTGVWYVIGSTSGMSAIQVGISGDIPVPADYDGDGKTDYAVYRPSSGTWFIRRSSNSQFSQFSLGQTGDIPLPNDFDGDGLADINVFRPSNGNWIRINSGNGQPVTSVFGQNGDVPLSGDFNGDGLGDLAVFRPSNGYWYVARPTGVPAQNFNATLFGFGTDVAVPADYDGDRKTDIAVFRPSTGVWYILNSTNNTVTAVTFGANGDLPVPAYYDGDGKADIAVFRPSTGVWYLRPSVMGASGVTFGAGSDIPLPHAYIR